MQNQLFPYDILRVTRKDNPGESLIINDIYYLGSASSSKALLFYLEIKKPPRMVIDDIMTLPNQILRGFHKNSDKSLLEQFENGLEFLNTFLTETLPSLKDDITFGIALIDDDNIHFTHFGNINCSIITKDTIRQVSKFKLKPPIEEISSGKLAPGQWLRLLQPNQPESLWLWYWQHSL